MMLPDFSAVVYLYNKLEQLNSTGESHHGVMPGKWTKANLLPVLDKYGFTLMGHYLRHGMCEGVSPYSKWNESDYMRNLSKATGTSIADLRFEMMSCQISALQHYELVGRQSGISMLNSNAQAPTKLNGNFYRYHGQECCRWLRYQLVNLLECVILGIMEDRPDTPPIIVGDACTWIPGENCPDHDTHDSLAVVDFDYPLYSGLGTQYGPVLEDIWIDRINMVLDEEKVNWWVIWQLITRLKCGVENLQKTWCRSQDIQYAPVDTQFALHEKIFDLVVKNITPQESADFKGITTRDCGDQFNHHMHMHCDLKIAWG